MPEEQGSRWQHRPVVIAAAGGVVLVTGVAGVSLLTGAGLPFHGAPPPVTIGITLTPDAAGTLVELVAESADSSLPTSLDLELPVKDDAQVDPKAGAKISAQGATAATGKRLIYSDVRDGLGTAMPAEQIRSGRLTGVRTDGSRLTVNYHVASVDGRRIVYPIPITDKLNWNVARIYVTDVGVTCLGDSPRGSHTFAPCSSGQEGEIDGTRHSRLRLELTVPGSS